MASCRSRRLAPASKVQDGEGVPYRVGDGLAARAAGRSAANRTRRRVSVSASSSSDIRAPVKTAL
jgi:hypothetical protein